MSKRTPGLCKRFKADGSYEWHIDKWLKGHGRLCESTGTDDEEKAGLHLARRIKEIRETTVGVRPRRRFREAATKFLTDNAHRKGIDRDALALKDLDSFIGDEWLDCVHNETFRPYIEARRRPPAQPPGKKRRRPLSVSTLNRNIGVARHVLNLAARLWRDKGSNLTWLAQTPLIQVLPNPGKRKPYPLDWDEQRLLFQELAPHLQRMALFDVNTGLRDQELCGLKWAWEQRVPELDTPQFKRSVFVLPASVAKNKEARVVILNDIAQSVVEEMRGQHPVYVFTWEDEDGNRNRVGKFRNSGWKNARRRAALKYEQELKRSCPEGFKRVRVHDLRHTFGRRLRAAGVGLEDRQDLLGHKAGRVTTEYSMAELGNLLHAANRIIKSRESPAPTVLRVVGE